MSKGQYSVARLTTTAIIMAGAVFITSANLKAEEAAGLNSQQALEAGSAAVQSGAFDSAIEKFTVALRDESLPPQTTAITLLNRGLAYQRINKLVEAIADYDNALQRNALTPAIRAVALYNRGLANRRLYRTTLALEDFTNALILNPRFAQAYNSRGNVLRELGYYGTALEDYTAAVRYEHPQIHIPLYGKALSHAALHDVEAAHKALTRALLVSPEYQPAQTLMARLGATPQPGPESTVVASAADGIQTGSVDAGSQTVIARTPAPFSEEAMQQQTQTAELLPDSVVATPAGGNLDRVAANTASASELPGHTRIEVTPPAPSGAVEQQAPAAVGPSEPITTAALQPETATSVEPEPQAAPSGFMIQLSAQRNADAARTIWNRLVDKHTDLLGNLTPYIVEADLGSRGIFYRIRAGVFSSRDQGTRLCGKLKSRRVDCFVVTSGG